MSRKFAATQILSPLTQPISAQTAALPRAEVIQPLTHTPRLSPIALALVIMAHFGAIATLTSLRLTSVQVPTTAMIVGVIMATQNAHKTSDITALKPTLTPPKPKSKPVSHQDRSTPTKTPILAAETPAPIPSAEVAKIAQPVALPSIQTSAPSTAPTHALQTAPRFDAEYLDNPAPVYPPLSRRAGEEGKVVLRVFVEPSGLPSRVEVRTSSGFERLDKSATATVERWRFIPARIGGDVVGAWVLVPINFSLKA